MLIANNCINACFIFKCIILRKCCETNVRMNKTKKGMNQTLNVQLSVIVPQVKILEFKRRFVCHEKTKEN